MSTHVDNTTFGKITDFTPGTVRKLIRSGEIDARISINRMEIIFAIEDLISDGIMSIEEGDEIMSNCSIERLNRKLSKPMIDMLRR